jgi:WD40 repeat protein
MWHKSHDKEQPVTAMSLRGVLSSISLSPDKLMCAVAGREVLGILALNPVTAPVGGTSAATLVTTTRSLEPVYLSNKSNQNNKFADICWHPSQRDTIATSAVSGTVAIWNLDSLSKQPSSSTSSSSSPLRRMVTEVEFKAGIWSRHASRLCWHPTDPRILMMSIQDGSIKLLDIREKVGPRNPITFPTEMPGSNAAPVRDVKISPFFTNHFASALYDGNVRLWDMRNPAMQLFQVRAHEKFTQALEWHPLNRDILASCGSNGVNVWDVSTWRPSSSVRIAPRYSMSPSLAVAMIHWRVEHPDEIASCAQTLDSKTYVWNVRRPHIPIAQFVGHTDVTVDFAWVDADTVITCSKDTTVRVQTVSRSAVKPFESIRTVAAAFDSRDRLAVSKEFLDRKVPVSDQDSTALMPREGLAETSIPWPEYFIPDGIAGSSSLQPPLSSAIPSVSISIAGNSPMASKIVRIRADSYHGPPRARSVRVFDIQPTFPGELDENTVFREIAKRSRIVCDGDRLAFEHNAKVYEALNRPQIGQLWRLAQCAFNPEPMADTDASSHEQGHLSFDPSRIFSSAADSDASA